jgi:D-threo-aldose 1-dehydrogenase
VELKAAAIQFPLRHPAVTAVLTGCRSVSELNENLSIFQSPIPDELWAEVVQ